MGGPGVAPWIRRRASAEVAGDRLAVVQGDAGVGGGLDRGEQAARDPDDDNQPFKDALHGGTFPLCGWTGRMPRPRNLPRRSRKTGNQDTPPVQSYWAPDQLSMPAESSWRWFRSRGKGDWADSMRAVGGPWPGPAA